MHLRPDIFILKGRLSSASSDEYLKLKAGAWQQGGIYNLPSHLSPGARDLIPRMLLVDPLKRITIPEIRQHPWFTVRLPRYLAVMQADTVASATTIDEEVVVEVGRCSFSEIFSVQMLSCCAPSRP